MGYSQRDIDDLRAGIALGALEVQFGSGPDSRRVTYRSLADMRSLLAEMEASIAPRAPSFRTTFVSHSRD